MFALLLPVVLTVFVLSSQQQEEESLVPYQSYISVRHQPVYATQLTFFNQRPDILAPSLNIRISNSSSLSPGYIFFSTWSDDGITQNGPYIYSNDGELIWSGHNPSYPSLKYFNFQTHHLQNETILSVFRGDSDHGRGKGHVDLLNSSYQVIRTIESPKRGKALDFHEFLFLDGNKTAVTVSLEPMQADLGFSEGMGWILDSVFRCIDLEEDEVVFEWRASEHIALNESVVGGPETKKRFAGMSYGNAYDYFHINSISRFQNGDFLISARHTDTIYRISGIDGTIIWRLGGSKASSSDFQLIGFNFSAQHDARIISEENDLITISLFDNAYNGKTSTANVSSAIVIKLDVGLGLARLLERFTPLNGGLAQNQGSMQNLPNGNMLVSWGLIAEFSEFDDEGKRVLDAAFVDETTRVYRVRRSEWVGMPKEEEIAVHLYARDHGSNAHFWMSWNGATEVREWAVYTTSPEGLLARVENEGFETHFDAGQFVEGGYVEAIGKEGEVLGRSKEIDTFVPSLEMKDICGDEHCTMQVLPSKDAVKDVGKERPAPFGRCLRLGWDMMSMNMVVCFFVGLLVGRLRWSKGGLERMRWLSKTAR